MYACLNTRFNNGGPSTNDHYRHRMFFSMKLNCLWCALPLSYIWFDLLMSMKSWIRSDALQSLIALIRKAETNPLRLTKVSIRTMRTFKPNSFNIVFYSRPLQSNPLWLWDCRTYPRSTEQNKPGLLFKLLMPATCSTWTNICRSLLLFSVK